MEETIDLSWGHPDFLKSYWDTGLKFVIDPSKDNSYFFGGLEELKNNIKVLHEHVGNVQIPEGYSIVIGNGATQLLNGLISIYNNRYVWAKAPHYHKFEKFAYINNKAWCNTDQHPESTTIVTLPNNPDGEWDDTSYASPIYDLSYNWPQYTDGEVLGFTHNAVVFSLAKCTGHASARIGWAIIKDGWLAEQLENYVEWSTGGVAIYAQQLANWAIQTQLEANRTVFSYGLQVLSERWLKIKELELKFEILNDQGMFLWCKGTPPDGIKVLMGSKMGSTNEYFRISIGCDDETFEKFINLLSK